MRCEVLMAFSVLDCDAMWSGRQAVMFLECWHLSTSLTGPGTAGYAFVRNDPPNEFYQGNG